MAKRLEYIRSNSYDWVAARHESANSLGGELVQDRQNLQKMIVRSTEGICSRQWTIRSVVECSYPEDTEN